MFRDDFVVKNQIFPERHATMIQINESSAASTSPSEADSTTDALTHILRQGARKMLAAAIEDEVNEFLDTRQHLRDEHGHRLVIRNGYGRRHK